jgi:glycosyltransferase involved in cell wall biosynthesis
VAAELVALGRVSDGELDWLYQNAACLVFPSHDEGFGLPVLEALAHGTPVIASEIPPVREIAGDAAIYFPVGSDKKLSQAMDDLLATTNDSDLGKLAAAGISRASNFNWAKTAARTRDGYLAALGQMSFPKQDL